MDTPKYVKHRIGPSDWALLMFAVIFGVVIVLVGVIYMQPLNMGKVGKIQLSDQTKAMTDAIYKMITENGN